MLKASRRITHFQRLKDTGELVAYLYISATALGEKLSAVLFQLPPNFKKDLPRLEAFLAALPQPGRAAMEFRHESWFEDDTFALLRAHGVALVPMDAGEGEAATPLLATAGWGYLRLRAETYADAELGAWAERIRAQPWAEAYVFFKHEEGAPALAARLLAVFAGQPFDATPG